MDRDMIIALANAVAMVKPADGWGFEFDYEQLELFAKLVAAAEREACIKAILDIDDYQSPAYPECIEVIRARGQ